MAREHDLVEPHRRPIAEGQRDPVLASPHRLNRRALVNVARQLRDEPGNVGVAAPGHDLPRRLRIEREQPVVVEEADERERGKRSDRVERGRPDGRRHGKQIPVGEALTETAGLEKIAERLAFRVRRLEQRGRLPIEAHDLAEQREVRRPHQVPPLREEPVGAAAAVLEPAPPARHREGHVRVAGGHAELAEEPHEVRIRAVVVDQEAGIERNGAGRHRRPPPCWYGRPVVDSFSKRWTRWRRLRKCAAAKPEMPAPITATVFIDVQEYQYPAHRVKHLSMTNH